MSSRRSTFVRAATLVIPLAAGGCVAGVVEHVPSPTARATPQAVAERHAPPEDVAPQASRPSGLDGRALAGLGDAALAAQIARVVAAIDATGRPPAGVVQGGRRRGPRGVFQNLEGRLPRRPPGYYEESDVWPPGPQGRGRLRLVFGREREVYFSGDHYRSFVRLR